MNALAEGGPVRGGKAYIVGEKGPELFVPRSKGGTVIHVGCQWPLCPECHPAEEKDVD